jgi:hypothetical protein
MPSVRRTAFLVAAAVSMAACAQSNEAPLPFPIALTSGDAQTVSVGKASTLPLTVTVYDMYHNPLQGAVVTWLVTSGGGTVAPVNSKGTTDLNGHATATYTAGTAAGTATITATLSGGLYLVTFTAKVQ